MTCVELEAMADAFAKNNDPRDNPYMKKAFIAGFLAGCNAAAEVAKLKWEVKDYNNEQEYTQGVIDTAHDTEKEIKALGKENK